MVILVEVKIKLIYEQFHLNRKRDHPEIIALKWHDSHLLCHSHHHHHLNSIIIHMHRHRGRLQLTINLINLIARQWLTRFNILRASDDIDSARVREYSVLCVLLPDALLWEINPLHTGKCCQLSPRWTYVNYCLSFQYLNENWHQNRHVQDTCSQCIHLYIRCVRLLWSNFIDNADQFEFESIVSNHLIYGDKWISRQATIFYWIYWHIDDIFSLKTGKKRLEISTVMVAYWEAVIDFHTFAFISAHSIAKAQAKPILHIPL